MNPSKYKKKQHTERKSEVNPEGQRSKKCNNVKGKPVNKNIDATVKSKSTMQKKTC